MRKTPVPNQCLWNSAQWVGSLQPLQGWNKEAVIKAITTAASSASPRWNEWEKIQQDIKSNDIYLDSQVDAIELVYGWVVEYDKSVSFYITTRDGHQHSGSDGEEDFLFREVSYYKSIHEAFQIFAFTIGNNSRIHSVRGLGYLIYQICNAMNVLTCKMMDNARVEGSMVFQANTQEDLEDLEIIEDFLPKPWELAAMEKKSKVTIMLEDSSVAFFKKQAKKYGVSYQAMIRNLLRDYSVKAIAINEKVVLL
jgi:predicted DNA binding CopG/RHH family protein